MIDVVSVDSDTTSGYFSKWVHASPNVWMLILQHIPACIQSSALDGCSMRISVNQFITVVVQKTHTKNNANSMCFNNNIKSKSNYNFKWHMHKTRPSIYVSWTLLSEAYVPSFTSVWHSYQRYVSFFRAIRVILHIGSSSGIGTKQGLPF